ncbi:hypothetical protein [Nitrosospira sp. Is2]|uniref:hypothetical protein n=1 Tax=Nitrosospira sp. Is2 TaxID=3080532 RepID=UPI00295474C9|nr:hypothetical protein [Nitrosospira sp. Is2]WON74307.1 hypothetical protein R5L00_02110 [Nitrosospira sp. Is2]
MITHAATRRLPSAGAGVPSNVFKWVRVTNRQARRPAITVKEASALRFERVKPGAVGQPAPRYPHYGEPSRQKLTILVQFVFDDKADRQVSHISRSQDFRVEGSYLAQFGQFPCAGQWGVSCCYKLEPYECMREEGKPDKRPARFLRH